MVQKIETAEMTVAEKVFRLDEKSKKGDRAYNRKQEREPGNQ